MNFKFEIRYLWIVLICNLIATMWLLLKVAEEPPVPPVVQHQTKFRQHRL